MGKERQEASTSFRVWDLDIYVYFGGLGYIGFIGFRDQRAV